MSSPELTKVASTGRRLVKPISMRYQNIVKFSIQIGLFTLFLVIFGVPSLERYNAKDVLTKSVEKSLKGLKLPAVTVCPRCIILNF